MEVLILCGEVSGVLAPEDLVELDGNQTNDLFAIYSDDIKNVLIFSYNTLSNHTKS